MAYHATCVAQDPLDYFLQHGNEESHLRISDVILRVNNSPNLIWHYVINKGVVWKIDEAQDDYKPQSDDEMVVLTLMEPEHRS